MVKALIIFTHYDFNNDNGTAHAIVHTNNGEINVHQFDFTYEYDEDSASDETDIRNMTDILKRHYGNDIEIKVKKVHKYHDVNYNK